MTINYKLRFFLSLFFTLKALLSYAQPYELPKLFLNCAYPCYEMYLKNELSGFRFVRDRFEADIEIFINGQESDNGGSTYFISLQGNGKYTNVRDSLSYFVYNFDTEEQRRNKLMKAIQLGLLRNMDQAMAYQLAKVEIIKPDTIEADHVSDPWNNIVFHIGSGLNTSGESLNSSLQSWSWLVMNRVTHASKINSWFEYNFNRKAFRLPDKQPIFVFTHNVDGRFYYVKSLTQHWSLGGIAQYYESVFSNIRSSYRGAAVVEYNIFPFSQSMKQQLRFAYQSGMQHFQYFDQTIFDKNKETRPYHRLALILDLTKPWGTIRSSIFGSTFLDNFSQNSTTVNHSMNLRVIKGLSIQVSASASIINDQISLAKAVFDESTLLLRGAQLQTSYTFNSYVELNYTFGSLNNSIVNPRLAQVD